MNRDYRSPSVDIVNRVSLSGGPQCYRVLTVRFWRRFPNWRHAPPLSFRGEVRSLMALAIRRSGEGELAR